MKYQLEATKGTVINYSKGTWQVLDQIEPWNEKATSNGFYMKAKKERIVHVLFMIGSKKNCVRVVSANYPLSINNSPKKTGSQILEPNY